MRNRSPRGSSTLTSRLTSRLHGPLLVAVIVVLIALAGFYVIEAFIAPNPLVRIVLRSLPVLPVAIWTLWYEKSRPLERQRPTIRVAGRVLLLMLLVAFAVAILGVIAMAAAGLWFVKSHVDIRTTTLAAATEDFQAIRQRFAAQKPLIELDEEVELDLTVDGADEVTPALDLVKGRGGALVRERIVASASRRQVILVGHEKLVRALGERGRVPLEVIPLARGPATRRLGALGLRPAVRADRDGARPLLTENGNLTLDCALAEPLRDARAARELEAALLAIPGVVDTGLFLGTAERVLVGYPDGRVDVLRPEGR